MMRLFSRAFSMNSPRFPRLFLFAALLPLLLFHTVLVAEPVNVLFIISDDLNHALGCYGHPVVRTPHIDRLAREGTRFEGAYCNYPVCNASRTSFLSGRHPRTTELAGNGVDPRVALGPDFQFLPEHFQARGYFTAGIGKITHTPEFLHTIQWDIVCDPQHDPAVRFEEKKEALKNAPDEEQPDGVTARTIARLMAEKRDKPFFLGAGFHRPHAPRIAPRKYFDMYPLDSLELPGGTTEPDIPAVARPPGYDSAMSEKERRHYLQSYYASVSFMDAQVGVLLEAMDRLDLWKNTVVIFLSDNGYHLGEHGGFWGKMSLMDLSGRVPLIVCTPGLPRGVVCRRAVGLVDLFPTLTALCRLPDPAGLEGASLVPLLEKPDASRPHPAQSVVVRGEKQKGRLHFGRSVHTDRHTLIQWPDASVQLYDDLADPGQTHNLAADPSHARLIAELKASLLPETSIPAHRGILSGEPDAGKKARKQQKRPRQ